MLCDRTSFVKLLDLDLILENLSPFSHSTMPPLSIDLAEDYLSSGFPLNFVEHLEPILTKLAPHDFLMSLAEERIYVEGSSSLKNVGSQFLAQSK
jgi:hypothetical protein